MVFKVVSFLQNDAPVHKTQIVMNKFWDLGFDLMENPPYSPDYLELSYFSKAEIKMWKIANFLPTNTKIEIVECWF